MFSALLLFSILLFLLAFAPSWRRSLAVRLVFAGPRAQGAHRGRVALILRRGPGARLAPGIACVRERWLWLPLWLSRRLWLSRACGSGLFARWLRAATRGGTEIQ